jgi:hypothetical protein
MMLTWRQTGEKAHPRDSKIRQDQTDMGKSESSMAF